MHDGVISNFGKVTPVEPMSFVPLHGNVDVTFPSNVKATTKIKSDRGEIYGGGPEYTIKNMHGGIIIRKK